MYDPVKTTLMSVALFGATPITATANDLVIGLDISDSAPLAINQPIAGRAGKLAGSRIKAMKLGDNVKLRSLGTYGTAGQSLYLTVKLSRKVRPFKVARHVDRLIQRLPALARTGKIKLQNETNIIGFLETIAPSLDCTKTPTTILILSDGIEHSSYIKGRDLLSGKKTLPAPSGQILKGCTLEMRGLAQQNKKLKSDPRWFARLRKNWARFAKAAGVRHFKAFAEYR